MRKLVVAGMLGLAAFTGWQGTALSQPLARAFSAPAAPAYEQPVILAQAGDAGRIQQLQEEIRQLNGRIEEMSFQLLQMQEQIRKAQEDNEFRFQDLEKGGAAPKKKSEAPAEPSSSGMAAASPSSGTGAPAGDDIATIIESQGTGAAAGGAQSPSAGAPESTLGSVKLDANGKPVGSTMNAPGANASSLPGAATASPSKKAAQGSDEDLYKAAYGHVLAGDYSVAEQEFQQYIASYPKGAKIADANFWLGEAQYSQGKYNDAAKTFLNGHQAYAKSPRAPEMLLKLGMSLAALDNPDVACKTLREVGTRYPAAPKAVLNKAVSEQKRLAC